MNLQLASMARSPLKEFNNFVGSLRTASCRDDPVLSNNCENVLNKVFMMSAAQAVSSSTSSVKKRKTNQVPTIDNAQTDTWNSSALLIMQVNVKPATAGGHIFNVRIDGERKLSCFGFHTEAPKGINKETQCPYQALLIIEVL